mmetsp:Transcript_4011/g.6310  ORF Transcript_4011/g.6310 Transcript_4011/m.6310 type:complete len:229 (+) Transcript_4011:3639-4325(+)
MVVFMVCGRVVVPRHQSRRPREVLAPILLTRPTEALMAIGATDVIAAIHLLVKRYTMGALLRLGRAEQYVKRVIFDLFVGELADVLHHRAPAIYFIAGDGRVRLLAADETEAMSVGTDGRLRQVTRGTAFARHRRVLGIELMYVHQEPAFRRGTPLQLHQINDAMLSLCEHAVHQVGALQQHGGPVQVQHLSALETGAAQAFQAIARHVRLQETRPATEAILVSGATR